MKIMAVCVTMLVAVLLWESASFAAESDTVKPASNNVFVPATGFEDDKPTSTRSSYDFAQDTTEVAAPTILFDYYSGDKMLPMEGWRTLGIVGFAYKYEGKAPKQPDSVCFIFGRLGYGENDIIHTIYLRFGNKKLALQVNDSKNVVGHISTADFIQLSQAKEVYFKVDEDPFGYVINGKYMDSVKALGATIPKSAPQSKPQTPKKETPPKKPTKKH